MEEKMRHYYDCLEMIKEVERDLAEMGIEYQSYSVQDQIVENDENYKTKELTGYAYKLFSTDNLGEMVLHQHDKEYLKWVIAESCERTAPPSNKHNPGFAWEKRKNFWKQYIRQGKFSYTYVERWNEQLQYILDELTRHPNTRQAIMTMYDRHQDMMNWGGLDRVPCSLTYQFLLRDNKLNLIYSMRSCDFINFFAADVYCSLALMEYIANTLGCGLGVFTHFIGSLHAFKKDMEGVF
jgi:thymidylate synthase